MNELEREYLENVRRLKRREDRRRVVFIGLCAVSICVLSCAYFVRDNAIGEAVTIIIGVVLLVLPRLVRLAPYLLKRFEDRNVEVASTERERAYREPAIMQRQEELRPTKPSVLALFALIPLGAVTFAIGVAIHDPRDRLIPLGITFTMMGFILVGQRLYGWWRARRNARLELQWEKWLDSADSCEVGPRKWTK